MNFQTFAGHRTATRRWEGGPGRALLVHCSLAHSGAWKGVASYLTDTHDCRAFDMPGHGSSAEWDGQGIYQDVVCAQIRGMIDEWDAPVDLIGHSFGATAALRVAATSPDLVRKLVLIEPVFFTAAYQADPAFEARAAIEGLPLKEAFAEKDYHHAAQIFLGNWGGGQPWDEMSAAQQDGFAAQMKLIEAVTVTNMGDPDGLLADGLVARMQIETLLIDGSDSPEASHRINLALQSLILPSRIETVEGAAHMVPITHSDQVGPMVAEFLG
ncbi:alpha/beta fold hydrolase [Pseudooceanicola sp. MF1-13]|uniref:alpha/beta fold hydrolase n=1 Tax=Pseudooceanicola sp. MF1-13 TaxID=3379095 RepID=UPI0038924008